jgi:hypothetical protein
MEIAVVIWLMFGFVSAYIAGQKGRSGCAWFIFGVLLGPIGLFIIAVIPSVQPRESRVAQTRRPAPPPPPQLVCSACGAKNQAGSDYCHVCGHAIGPARCPNCKADTSHDSSFCHVCGTSLSPEADSNPPAE